jgi:hypothetical protein
MKNSHFPLLASEIANVFNLGIELLHFFLVEDENETPLFGPALVKGKDWKSIKGKIMLSEYAFDEIFRWEKKFSEEGFSDNTISNN